MLSMIIYVKSVTELPLEKTMKRTIVEPATEFSPAVGIRVVRRGRPVPPLYHNLLLPAGAPRLKLV
jgi:hypothetical protein